MWSLILIVHLYLKSPLHYRGGHGWCWGRSSKSQSIIGLGLGFEKKLKRCLSLLALDCTLKMVALHLSPQTLALKICSVVGAT
jgi:hypothetical protein